MDSADARWWMLWIHSIESPGEMDKKNNTKVIEAAYKGGERA